MRKQDDFDYFKAYKKQAEYAEEMVLNLKSAVAAGELGQRCLMEALHTVENDADAVNQEIQSHLMKDFVVPLERGGMCRLAHTLDDVSDAVEDVAICGYCYGVGQVGDAGLRILDMMAQAAVELEAALDHLSDCAKHGAQVSHHLVEVQNLESKCDREYIEALHAMYQEVGVDPEERRIRTLLLSALEDAMDSMENAAEAVEAALAESA